MKIRLTQIDGILPNIALMKLSHYFKNNGDEVYFEKSVNKSMFEPDYDHVFASAIFTESKKKIELMKSHFPNTIFGGTGTTNQLTVEQYIEVPEYENYDYAIYPDYPFSIGFSQRGCRLKCPFCVVPNKEGKNVSINTMDELYRGEPFPKNIVLLDNDFFGQSDWESKCNNIIDGNYKVSFSQGINIRLFNEEQTEYLSRIKCYDRKFKRKYIYTAWDNAKDEKRFFKGINLLIDKGGFKPYQISVYFLCNYWQGGLTEDIWFRYKRMMEIGLRPYCMIFDKSLLPPKHDLKAFQNWINTHNHIKKPTREGFEEYKIYYHRKNKHVDKSQIELF